MLDTDKKIRDLQAIQKGKGISYLLNEAYEILGYPLLLHDMEYQLIAHTEKALVDDPFWQEFMDCGRLSEASIHFCAEECFIDAVANCDRVTHLVSDKLRLSRLFGQVYNAKGIPVADLIIMGDGNPFAEDAPILTEALCQEITKEMATSPFYEAYGHTYQEAIVRKLIEGDVGRRDLYAGHVANLYKGLKSNIYLAICDITKADPAGEKLSHFRDLLYQAQPTHKYFIYRDTLIALISLNERILWPQRHMPYLAAFIEEKDLFLGLSDRFENLFAMQARYREAQAALAYGFAKGEEGQRVFLYGDIPD